MNAAADGVAGPTVSIVVPTHDRPYFLPRALDSVASQTFGDWELIVVDDNDASSGARAQTQELVRRYMADARIRYIEHERNRGGAVARNTGVRHARGRYIAFLDDDDEWRPSKLEDQLQALAQAGQRAGVVFTGVEAVDAQSGKAAASLPQRQGRLYPDILGRNFVGTTSSLLCKREVLERVGLFDERLAAAQDYDLCIRLAQVCEFVAVENVLVIRHKHVQKRITHDHVRKVTAFDAIYEKHRSVLDRNRGLRSDFLFAKARFQILAGDRQGAAGTFARAFRATPLRPKLLGYAIFASFGGGWYSAARRTKQRLGGFVRRLGREGA